MYVRLAGLKRSLNSHFSLVIVFRRPSQFRENQVVSDGQVDRLAGDIILRDYNAAVGVFPKLLPDDFTLFLRDFSVYLDRTEYT